MLSTDCSLRQPAGQRHLLPSGRPWLWLPG